MGSCSKVRKSSAKADHSSFLAVRQPKISALLFDASVDVNPHQVDAAMFAFPLSMRTAVIDISKQPIAASITYLALDLLKLTRVDQILHDRSLTKRAHSRQAKARVLAYTLAGKV